MSSDVTAEIATRMNVREWISIERRVHADPKWNEGENRQVARDHMEGDPHGEWWSNYVGSYLHRASVLGLDTPAGRQALGKATVTLLHMLETAVMVYGPLPQAGMPSGEIFT